MKKFVLFLIVAFFTINSYSQKNEGDRWREVAKYLFDEGFDRNELRNTVQLVRDMSKEIFNKKKISKKTEKKLKNLSFNEDQIEILKTLSQKMSKIVGESMKREESEMNSFENNNQNGFNRARGDFNQNNRARGGNSRARGGQRGGQRLGSNNGQSPARPEVNPVLQRLAQYVREQGVDRENMRSVMNVIMRIGREYKASAERSSYKPSEESLSSLKKSGLSDETVEAVIEVIKALAIYDK